MRKRIDLLCLIALLSLTLSHPANALTVPVEAPSGTPSLIGLIEHTITGVIQGAETIIASIETSVGDLASAVSNPTPSIPPASPRAAYTAASAASVASPPVADDSPPPPTSAPDPTPMTLVHTTRSKNAAVNYAEVSVTPAVNVFTVDNALGELAERVQALSTLVTSLQSTLPSQASGQSYDASAAFPQQIGGDGSGNGLAAASNIGNLSGVTITNATINAASIPNLSGSYLSLGGGALTGSLGIGTTTPNSLLSLGGIANFTTATSTLYSSGGFNIEHGCYAVSGTCITAGGGGSSQWTTAGSNIYFSTGNIGIGTTSPSRLLTLDSSSATGTILRMSNTSAGGHIYDFLETGSANTGGAGRLDFFDSTAGAARLSIAANGNVGVGTTSPSTNFAVNGNGYFSGGLTATNASTTNLTATGTSYFGSALTQIANGCNNADQYPSIQGAITAASSTGCVTLTPLTTDTNWWYNPNALTIIDQRPTTRVGQFLGGASVTPQLANFANGSVANKTIIYFGNSTVWNATGWFDTMAYQDISGGLLAGMNIHQDVQSVSADANGNFTVVLGSPSNFNVGQFVTVEPSLGTVPPCTGIVTSVSGDQFTASSNQCFNIATTSTGGIASQQLLNFGNNGATLAGMLSGSFTSATSTGIGGICAVKPDLLIIRGPLINDVRTGATNLAQAEALERQLLDTVRSCSPNTDIYLKTENSLLTTNVGGYNYVTPNSSAQAYSTILEQAVDAFANVYPNVYVLDTQKSLYGTTSPATSAYMGDQLHPNATGADAEAQEDIQVLTHLMNNGFQSVGTVDPNNTTVVPFSPYLAQNARANNYSQPWTFYPYACADPNYYTLVATGQAATSFAAGSTYFQFTWPGAASNGIGASGVIQSYDVVEQQTSGCWQLPLGSYATDYGGGSTYYTDVFLGSGSTTPYATTAGEQIQIWRPKYIAQAAETYLKNPTTYTYQHRITISGGSNYFQFSFLPSEELRASASEANTSDFLVLNGTTTVISLSNCNLTVNASQGSMICNQSGSYSSLDGQYGWIIGTQPMEGRPNTYGQLLVGGSTKLPAAALTVWGPDTTTTNAFLVVNSASTTEFSVSDNGTVGIGTSTPGSIFSIAGVGNWTTGTSTLYGSGGINIAGGCFAINGTCISGSGGGGTTYTFSYPLLNTGNTISEAWGTTTANIWSQLQTFTSGFISNASSTVVGNFTATGNGAFSGTTGTTSVAAGQGFTVGNSQLVVQQGNGDVGIGTSTLGSLFDVAGTYSGNGFNTPFTVANINPTLGGYPGSAITNTILNIQPTSDVFTNDDGATLDGLDVNLTGIPYSSSYRTYPAIFQGGNVGVGTTTPASTFTVAGTAAFSETVAGGGFTNPFTAVSVSPYLGGYPGSAMTNTILSVVPNYNGWSNLNSATLVGLDVDVSGSNGIKYAATLLGGNVGIGTTSPQARLEVWGVDTSGTTTAFLVSNNASTSEFAVYDSGNATLAGSLVQNSDIRLKTNISDLDGSSSLAEIDALNPVTFNWIDPQKSSVPQFGFIAQQVEQVFPNLVSTTSPTALTPDGTLSLNYIDLISPIVAAMQELDKEITSLESTVASFAESFTSSQITATNELCVDKANGTAVCVTGDQLAAVLASANQSADAPASPSSSPSDATDTPPVIQINGANPATIQVGASYSDLGATITGPQADLNLGIETYLNGILANPIELDTSTAATDTIAYVVTDQNGLTSTSSRTVIIEPAATPPPPPSAEATSTVATSSSATSTVQ